jgi:hypothetical protein
LQFGDRLKKVGGPPARFWRDSGAIRRTAALISRIREQVAQPMFQELRQSKSNALSQKPILVDLRQQVVCEGI